MIDGIHWRAHRWKCIYDSVLGKWVFDATATFLYLYHPVRILCLIFSFGEIHEDFRKTRMNRFAADISKLAALFENHPPFPEIHKIILIYYGVIEVETVTYFKTLKLEVKK